MSTSEEIDRTEQGNGMVQQEPSIRNMPSIDPQFSLNQTLLDINTNMGNKAALLEKLSSGALSQRQFEHPSTGQLEAMSTKQHNLPTGHASLMTTGQNLSNKRQLSISDESESPQKIASSLDDVDSDSLSVHADDDNDSLVGDTHDLVAKPSENPETQTSDFLDGLPKALESSDDLGPNVKKRLAKIVNKHWGKTLNPEEMKLILEKYKRPGNCTEMYPIKVNKSAWEHLRYAKIQEDLRLANMQQVLRKAAYIMLQNTDFMLTQASTSQNRDEFNKHVSQSIDAFALLGHLNRNISSLR